MSVPFQNEQKQKKVVGRQRYDGESSIFPLAVIFFISSLNQVAVTLSYCAITDHISSTICLVIISLCLEFRLISSRWATLILVDPCDKYSDLGFQIKGLHS